MPSTASIITEIKNAVQNYSREQIREKLDELQLIVYATGAVQTEDIDTNTGMPPFLTTIQGQRHYSLGDDVRQTIAVFTEKSRRGYSPYHDEYTRVYRSTYLRVAIRSTDKLLNTNATLTFVNDPGTTSDHYYHRYVKEDTRITSENVQLVLPEHVHWILREGVIAMLSSENYGDIGKKRELIRQISLEVANELGKGDQGKSIRTPIRAEQQSLDGEFGGFY
ncbi:MAG TPA: hypothetical protein VMV77_12500 [Bacteroidales bacterium]|nr:hypothetical protein [Bacteroidales bacterium]